jgi:hypothetical protein
MDVRQLGTTATCQDGEHRKDGFDHHDHYLCVRRTRRVRRLVDGHRAPVTTVNIEVEAGAASARAYVRFDCGFEGAHGPELLTALAGYLDRFEGRDDEWHITRRRSSSIIANSARSTSFRLWNDRQTSRPTTSSIGCRRKTLTGPKPDRKVPNQAHAWFMYQESNAG